MSIINYIKFVEYLGERRFKVTFTDQSSLVIANDKSYWYSMYRTQGYAEIAKLGELQYIDFYQLANLHKTKEA